MTVDMPSTIAPNTKSACRAITELRLGIGKLTTLTLFGVARERRLLETHVLLSTFVKSPKLGATNLPLPDVCPPAARCGFEERHCATKRLKTGTSPRQTAPCATRWPASLALPHCSTPTRFGSPGQPARRPKASALRAPRGTRICMVFQSQRRGR